MSNLLRTACMACILFSLWVTMNPDCETFALDFSALQLYISLTPSDRLLHILWDFFSLHP